MRIRDIKKGDFTPEEYAIVVAVAEHGWLRGAGSASLQLWRDRLRGAMDCSTMSQGILDNLKVPFVIVSGKEETVRIRLPQTQADQDLAKHQRLTREMKHLLDYHANARKYLDEIEARMVEIDALLAAPCT